MIAGAGRSNFFCLPLDFASAMETFGGSLICAYEMGEVSEKRFTGRGGSLAVSPLVIAS